MTRCRRGDRVVRGHLGCQVQPARCVDAVPAEVPVGLHLCYGDWGHQHFKQPESLALQIRVLNAVTVAAGRTVSFVSFTVPQDQRAESYFAPLAGLGTGPDTELHFGIVPYHRGDQAPGTTGDQARLIDAALADSPSGTREWGVCTECGMGRAGQQECRHCWTCTARFSRASAEPGTEVDEGIAGARYSASRLPRAAP